MKTEIVLATPDRAESLQKMREQLVFAKATLEMAARGISDKQLLAVVRDAIKKIETGIE